MTVIPVGFDLFLFVMSAHLPAIIKSLTVVYFTESNGTPFMESYIIYLYTEGLLQLYKDNRQLILTLILK